jgi:GNAT superfamily N-acetyltransferase
MSMTETRTIVGEFCSPALMGEVLELWNRSIGRSFPLDARLYRQQLSLERDEMALLTARETGGDKLQGAALVKRCRRRLPKGGPASNGNLSFIVVAPEARRRGIGSALLSSAEGWVRERGAKSLHLGRDRYHFFPGCPLGGDPAEAAGFAALASFLTARSFALANEEADLAADLKRLDLKALAARAPLAPGFRFRLYDPSLRPSLLAFFERNFPGRWLEDTFEALDAGMRGIDLALLTEEKSGEVVGFSRIYDGGSPILGPGVYWRGLMGAAPGGLGPIGVDEAKRGLGLGLGLLRCCVEELAGRGVGVMVIDWTDLEAFYGKLGFGVWKKYRMASKEL